jgi:hypothetical protein
VAARQSSLIVQAESAQSLLLACGSMVLTILSVFRFCAQRAQKRNTKEDKAPLLMILMPEPSVR